VPWQGLIPLFVLGITFGYLYERTGSLLPPILAHAIFNAANIGIALVIPDLPPA
jgi:membrane protease YdiL (CAAX protease family)